ncbi:LysR family transcriptional regulator [Halovulum sp. GXIMD14794]
MLNATWIETFTTLAEEGSFTATARRLNMTQPGVSQHVRKLEQALGAKLVMVTGRDLRLTDAGHELRALGLARRAEEAALAVRIGRDDPEAGRVRIGASGSFASLLYPRLMDRLAVAPALELQLTAAPQGSLIEAISAGRLDLAVVARDPGRAGIEAQQLGHEDLCLVLPGTAPDGMPALEDLDTLGFIDHPDGAAYAEMLMQPNVPGFRGAAALRRRGFVNQITQIPLPVASGAGYTILPRSGVDAFAGSGKLRLAPLPRPVRQTLWQIRPAGLPIPARLAWMADEIAALARTLTG